MQQLGEQQLGETGRLASEGAAGDSVAESRSIVDAFSPRQHPQRSDDAEGRADGLASGVAVQTPTSTTAPDSSQRTNGTAVETAIERASKLWRTWLNMAA